MGEADAHQAVADAGPLIHLDEVGRPEPWELFASVVVPSPVVEELRSRPEAPGAGTVRDDPFQTAPLTGEDKRQAETWSHDYDIGLTDAAVLAVADHRNVDLVLTDDLDLRDACHLTGVRPVGSVGLVLRAARTDRLGIDEAEDALDALLTESSLFLVPSLVVKAKRALRDALG